MSFIGSRRSLLWRRKAASAPIYSAEALAVFAAFTTPPTTARKDLIDALIVALKNNSIWSRLDLLYLFCAADAQAARINWVDPGGLHTATEVNSPTFSADHGYTGNGTTSYLTSGLNANAATNFKTNNGHGFIAASVAVNGNNDVGTLGGSDLILNVRNASGSNQAQGRIGNVTPSVVQSTGRGVTAVNAKTSNSTQLFRDGAQIATATGTTVAATANPFLILRGSTTFCSDTVNAMGVGASLTDPQISALNTALHAYLNGITAGLLP